MPENIHDVVISGAGPNGLMLACELRLAGIRPVVLEALPEPSRRPKANGLLGEVVRLLDMRGLYTELTGNTGAPEPIPLYIFGALPLKLTAVHPNPIRMLPIPQPDLVRRMVRHATDLGVEIRWGNALTDFRHTPDGVTIEVTGPDGPYALDARYLVGADGGKSVVRKQTGIDFPGYTSTAHIVRVGHAEIPDHLRTPEGGIDIPGAGRFPLGHTRLENGLFVYAAIHPGQPPLIGAGEHDGGDAIDEDAPMTFDELRAAVERVLGIPLPMEPPVGSGPFTLRRTVGQNTRVAEHYRSGNVLLLGDAAHVHSAMGGPGLNLGLQDAVNLGWKLAATLNGWAPEGLLDTYESERHALAERVVMHSLSQSALVGPGPEITALRALFGELLELPAVQSHIANLMAGSDTRYDIGDSHPLSGHLMPELSAGIDGRTVRITELMHEARPLLLDYGMNPEIAEIAAGWSDRVRLVTATSSTPPAAALLIRPDGYIAWAADDFTETTGSGLHAALTRWFGQSNHSGSPAAMSLRSTVGS
ncbi:FAD-dependent monooxygenase [Nocardia sp. NPDC020380]|uniref:FAD-dependent monooxygenase n=1 Tax=Nocardia sp. NPDC020380 TaxID=3364309 RepID=UPI0037985ACB